MPAPPRRPSSSSQPKVGGRPVLQPDPAVVPSPLEMAEEEPVVDLTGAGLVPPGTSATWMWLISSQ